MYFQTAPYTELCTCVSVTLTVDQERLIDSHPGWTESIVHAAIKSGRQYRDCTADCPICAGYGIKPMPVSA